ncbi:MAG: hypothetical protein IJ094_00385 [Bacilli bacterium]|nr:hypothetical protein [Bacilli bacterium]
MKKNILVIGAPRSGKISLARKISKTLGYSVISLDDIVSGLSAYKDLNIAHDSDDYEVSKKFSKFLKIYLKELAEGSNFYSDIKYVIEGTHIDLDYLLPFDNMDKYEIIGLTFNDIDKDTMYSNIKKYDTEDEWTYYLSDEDLKGDINFFIERNKFFYEEFLKHNIKYYDTSISREDAFNSAIRYFKNNTK